MKNRLLAYLILFPVILLLSIAPIGKWLSYITATVWVLCGVVVFIAYKRIKYLSKIKKGLVILLMTIALLVSFGSEKSFAMTDEEFSECQRQILELTEIPEGLRTNDQNRKLEKLLEEYKKEVKERNKGDKACPTAKQMIKNVLSDCWLCDVVYVIVESMDKLASSFLNKVRQGEYAVLLMCFGLAFWIVMRVLGHIMTLGMGDTGSFITELVKRGLLVCLLAFFIHMPIRKMVDLFITPVFTFSAALSNSIQAANTSKEGEEFSNILTRKSGVSSFQCSYCNQLGSSASAVPDGESKYAAYTNRVLDNRAISPAFRNSLLCITCNVYALTAPASVLGEYMMCAGIEDFTPILGPLDKITGWFTDVHIGFYNLPLYITGLILYICFFVVSAIFVFPLIENFFRIGFVIVLLPFLIAAYAFPSTRVYTKRGFQLLLYAMFVFLSISIFLTVIMAIFNSLFLGRADTVATMIVNNDANGLSRYFFFSPLPYGSVIFYGSLLLVFLAWQLYKTLDDFCQQLTGVNLTSSGGFDAVQSAWGSLVATKSVIDTVYNAPWAPSARAERNMKQDARLRGANPYHSTESIAKGIESRTASTARRYEGKIKEAGERLSDKAKSNVSLLNQKVDNTLATAGQSLSAFLTRKGAEWTSRSNDSNASKLSKTTSLFVGAILLGSSHLVNGTSKGVRFVTSLGGALLEKVAGPGIRLLGEGLGTLTKKVGIRLSKEKYYTKTVALLGYKLPQKVKTKAADLVYTATMIALGGISGYHKLVARLKGNKDTLNPNGSANGSGEQTNKEETAKKTTFKEKMSRLFVFPVLFGQTKKKNKDEDEKRKDNRKPEEKKNETNDRRRSGPDGKGQGGPNGTGKGQQGSGVRVKSEFEKELERINIKAFKYYSRNTYRSERESWLNRPIDGAFFTDAYKAVKKEVEEDKKIVKDIRDTFFKRKNRGKRDSKS